MMTKSPTVEDMFQPVLDYISCTGATGRLTATQKGSHVSGLIGVSLSEPNTSESNGGFSIHILYIYIYVCQVLFI